MADRCNLYEERNSINRQLLKKAALNFPDKIRYPFDAMIDLDGFDAICAMSDVMGGATIHIPQLRQIFHGCLIEQAKVDYFETGMHLAILARKYGYTERTMRKLLKGK